MITTCTEYEQRRNVAFERYHALADGASKELDKCREPIDAWYEINEPKANTQAKRDALREKYNNLLKPCLDAYDAVVDTAQAEYEAEDEALQQEAWPTLAVRRVAIITTPSLEQEAQQIRQAHIADDPPIRVVRSFDELRQEIEADRCWHTLVLLLEAEGGVIRFGSKGHTLTELANLWKPTAKLRAHEVVSFEGRSIGPPPNDAQEWADLLQHPGPVFEHWIIESDPLSTQCFSPIVLGGPAIAPLWGLLAHSSIELDYEKRQQVKRETRRDPGDLYVDDSFIGPVDRRYGRFLLRKNPGLSLAGRIYLRMALRRPDLLLDDGVRKEFEEIKPDNFAGIWSGREKITSIGIYMRLLGLPYKRGLTYVPPKTIPLLTTSLGGIPVELSFSVRREQAGLIVYNVCVRTDWTKVIFGAAFIAFLVIVLRELVRHIPSPVPA